MFDQYSKGRFLHKIGRPQNSVIRKFYKFSLILIRSIQGLNPIQTSFNRIFIEKSSLH